MQNVFREVNLLDAEAAMKVLAQTLGKINGYDVEVNVFTFRYARDILSGPHAGNIDLMILDSWSYVEIEQADWIEPLFVSEEEGQMESRYFLLTNGKKDLDSLSDLNGKSLNLLTAANAMLGPPWLQTLLLEKRLGKPEDFFRQINYQSDSMRTILPVFFGKVDAALIDSIRYELMAELNPQLNNMKVIEKSEPFVSYILCSKRSGWALPRLKQDIIRVASNLHIEPKAQQVFTLFKFGRLVPYEPHQLDTVRQLHQRAIKLEKQTTGAADRPIGN